MKPVYVSYALLVCFCAPVYAQVLDSHVLDTTLRNTDAIADEVARDVISRELIDRDLINTDLITRDLLDTEVVNTQLDSTLRAVDDVAGKVQGKLEPVLDPLTKPVNDLLGSAPLDAIANSLPVLTRNGETAFVDVQVEDGWRAVAHEWLIMLDKTELAVLQPLHADIVEQTNFDGLDLVLVRFRVPAVLDSRGALKQKLPAHLHEQLDRNHIYAAQANATSASANNTEDFSPVCDAPVKIGMIDTAINKDHSAFAQSKIITRDFLGEQFDAPLAHGTAIAGLLVGKGESLRALLPKATLYSASVFYARNQYAQGATMMDLVRALNWLAEENVSTINMSLAGPDNQILRAVVNKVLQQGIAIVAAAGNEGPAAPPMYPAAYTDVIAVTAVDREHKIYRWANRGDHIDFAALGVSVTTARSDGGFGRQTGTSIAAPVVSAFVACELAKQKITSAELPSVLAKKARDLGDAGRDPVFGFGFLGAAQNVTAKLTDAKVSE
ncbi:MAG: S8 family serine peptidase [Cellvibrio sp.]|uniref:S8 family serine peptidase n=1 Tax=Cellvibrio sp. TaxID=1965322 RepID=UPI0031A11105